MDRLLTSAIIRGIKFNPEVNHPVISCNKQILTFILVMILYNYKIFLTNSKVIDYIITFIGYLGQLFSVKSKNLYLYPKPKIFEKPI